MQNLSQLGIEDGRLSDKLFQLNKLLNELKDKVVISAVGDVHKIMSVVHLVNDKGIILLVTPVGK